MRYDQSDLRERLAADYALGSLRGAARQRLERLMRDDPAMAAAVETWQLRLNGLAEALPPVEPPPAVWARIVQQIGRSGTASNVVQFPVPRAGGLWQNIVLWRGLGIAATAIAAALAIFIVLREPQIADMAPVAVLDDDSGHPAFVASASVRGHVLTLAGLSDAHAQAGKVYQLWLLPKSGNPRSLGLVPPLERASFELSFEEIGSLASADGVAISLEPEGGSPTGLPTGPILFKGALIARR